MKDKLKDFFKNNFADSLIKEDTFRGDLSFYVEKEALLSICQALQEDVELNVNLLADITSVISKNEANILGVNTKILDNKTVDGCFTISGLFYTIGKKKNNILPVYHNRFLYIRAGQHI